MLTVYVVDDDFNVCQCFEELIDWPSLGCDPPVICRNGANALEKMNTRPPDLVISDLKMPVMDGVTLCREIRKRNADVEIIFLSAYEDFSTAQLALKYGVQDYILKPLTRHFRADTFPGSCAAGLQPASVPYAAGNRRPDSCRPAKPRWRRH